MSEPSELVLSASSLKSWLTCGRKYWYEQVLRVPGAPNMAMAIGTAVHAGIEALHKGENLPRLNVGLGLAAEIGKMSPLPSSEECQQASDDALTMFEMYQEKVAPTFRPTMIERSFVIRVNGTLVSGQIDAADEDVHDTKTTATLSKFRPEKHRLQLNLYRMGFRSITGRNPARLLLDVLARNGRYKQVEIDVDEGEAVDVIALASRAILSGDYEPTGTLNGSCPRCPFSQICEFSEVA